MSASPNFDDLPDTAYVRQSQLLTVIPISAATLWRMVKAGTFPASTKLTQRCTAWKIGEVRRWLQARAAKAA